MTGVHVRGVLTVRVNVLVTVRPVLLKARTIMVYVPAGRGSVTRTTPVIESPASVPLKLVEVETVTLVVLVGGESGVTVVFVLNGKDASG